MLRMLRIHFPLFADVHNQEEQDSDLTWNILSAAAKRCRVDQDEIQIESVIAQPLVNTSDFNFEMIHLLIHFSDHICQLGNLVNASSVFPQRAIIDLKPV